MKKRAIPSVIVLILLFSLILVVPVTANAQEVGLSENGAEAVLSEVGIPSESQFASSIDSLQQTYVNGQYWNKASSPDYSRTGIIPCDGISYSSSHYGMRCSAVGYCDYCSCECGYFAGGYQCVGFAYKLASLSLGSYPGQSGWSLSYSLGTVNAGDVIRIRNDSHTIFVYKVVGDTIYFADSNFTGPCQVRWGGAYSYSQLASVFTYKWHLSGNTLTGNPVTKPSNAWFSASHRALPIGWDITFTFGADNATNFWIGIDRNGSRIITEEVSSGKSYHFTETGNYSAYVTAGNSAGSVDSNKVEFTVYQARNIGERFTAAILHTKSGVAVTADDSGNVVVKQYKGTDNQLWNFEREGEYKRYKITNVKTGKCLDVYNGGTVDDTNIQVWRDNGATAQRWYLRPNSSGYSLAPMCASHGSIDMVGGNSSDGNNIAMWYCVEGNSNQIFTLQIIDAPAYTATFNGHKYELYNTSVAWKEAFQYCEQQGGHLVTINSQSEQDFINGLISNSTYPRIWAGGMDGYTEGRWQWITGESFSYSNWGIGEPNNANDEDYLMLSRSDGKWNDVADVFNNTENNYSFICEYDDVIESARVRFEKAFNYNNHRYEVYSGSLDWLSAKLFCEQKGGHLVTITTAGENSAITTNVKSLNHEAYWLGLTDVEHESKWHWITDEAYTYKNWSDKEPNNSGGIEDYAVYVSANEKWNDLTGRAVLNTDVAFICEYDKIPVLGDVDVDGDVEIRDSTWIQRHIAKEEIPFVINKATADVDGDGIITVMDATAIQYYLANIKTSYKIGEKIE